MIKEFINIEYLCQGNEKQRRAYGAIINIEIMNILKEYNLGFIFEIFGQSIKTTHQNAYRHMIVENRILKIAGKKARETIRDLKRNGYKTEPAFGAYLKVSGDPYDFLLSMYEWNYNELKEYLKNVNGLR